VRGDRPPRAAAALPYAGRVRRAAALLAPPVAALTGAYGLVIRGALTLDLGIGRRVRPRGPIAVAIAAPPETVFDVIAAPYLARTPRAMRDKLEVWERGEDMVLAAHHTVTGRIRTTTVETVVFDRPHRISFRVVRGPVPHVVERYDLRPDGAGTTLRYAGELGADLWALGRWWADRVARRWEAAVAASLEPIRVEAERRTGAVSARARA
jgi:hypothetical protein